MLKEVCHWGWALWFPKLKSGSLSLTEILTSPLLCLPACCQVLHHDDTGPLKLYGSPDSILSFIRAVMVMVYLHSNSILSFLWVPDLLTLSSENNLIHQDITKAIQIRSKIKKITILQSLLSGSRCQYYTEGSL